MIWPIHFFCYFVQMMGKVTAKLSGSLFYLTGPKKTVPECAVEVKPDFNPSVSFHHYVPTYKGCSGKAIHYLPFFLDNYGPIYSEWTTTAHETLPGHHMEVNNIQLFQKGWLLTSAKIRIAQHDGSLKFC